MISDTSAGVSPLCSELTNVEYKNFGNVGLRYEDSQVSPEAATVTCSSESGSLPVLNNANVKTALSALYGKQIITNY